MSNLLFNRLFMAILNADNLADARERFKREQAAIQDDPRFENLFSINSGL